MSHCGYMISIVVATDKNGVIGRENKIPWRIRDDLRNLRDLTCEHTVILGRKTYDSLVGYYNWSGRKMPGKMYIIISRNTGYKPERENAQVVHSVQDALKLAESLKDENILVIGGSAVFEAMLPITERIYLTEVQADIPGDAHFPPLNMQQWQEVSRKHYKKDDRNEYDFDMVVLERR